MLKGLRTVIYKVSELNRAKAWYSDVFGIAPYFDEPFYVGFSVGGFELGLLPDSGPSIQGGVCAYWGVDKIEEVVALLVEKGAVLNEAVSDVGEGIKVASVIDPFGNTFGVIENPKFRLADVR